MNVALLIDLDNIKNENSLSRMFVELSSFGDVRFKYGFYSNFNDKSMGSMLKKYGIIPIMFPQFVGGKSCSDIHLTIKAMDLLKNNKIDCFAIASNDSDFNSLSVRLRKSNKETIIITDKQSINEEQYKYYNKNIRIYDLLNPKVDMNEILASNIELPAINGEKNEVAEETTKNSKPILDSTMVNVDNIQHIDYSNEPDKNIRELLTRIDVAFRNININNDYAKLNELIMFLNKDGKKFDPRAYGHTNGRAKDFFEKQLSRYMQLETRGLVVYIKFKEGKIEHGSK